MKYYLIFILLLFSAICLGIIKVSWFWFIMILLLPLWLLVLIVAVLCTWLSVYIIIELIKDIKNRLIK